MEYMNEEINMVEAINMALDHAMEDDKNVILLGEDIADAEGGGTIGVTKGLSSKFGDSRVRSTPIAEQAIVGAAIGSAIAGMRPVVEIMTMNFITIAMDMIVNHAAKLRFMSGGRIQVPITIRTIGGVSAGVGGQHGDFFDAWFAHVPGIKVVAPATPADAYGLMLSCIEDTNPCIFIENSNSYFDVGPAPLKGKKIPIGKSSIVREGHDITVITYSKLVSDAAKVSDRLSLQGISVEVIDLKTVSPLDEKTIISSLNKTRRGVIVQEAKPVCSIGSEISTLANSKLFNILASPIEIVASKLCPIPFSKALADAYMPNEASIEQAIFRALEKNKF